MTTTRGTQLSPRERSERQALRRRVQLFHSRFNKGLWKDCFALIDPQLTHEGKVELPKYADLMQAFKQVYGTIKSRWTDLSLHLEVSPKQRDRRPFAYVYVLWQDEGHAFHMFRERWIQHRGKWYTRVVGLVPNQQETDSQRAG